MQELPQPTMGHRLLPRHLYLIPCRQMIHHSMPQRMSDSQMPAKRPGTHWARAAMQSHPQRPHGSSSGGMTRLIHSYMRLAIAGASSNGTLGTLGSPELAQQGNAPPGGIVTIKPEHSLSPQGTVGALDIPMH